MGANKKNNSEDLVIGYLRNDQNRMQSNIANYFRNEEDKITRYLQGKYRLNSEDAKDCFMQGSIALWRNIKEGVLTTENLTSSLSTYLTRCCCNHATHILEKKKREVPIDRLLNLPKTSEYGFNNRNDDFKSNNKNEFMDYKDEQIQIIEKIIRTLPEPCNTVLWNVYFNYHEIEKECQDKESIMDIIALMIGMKKTVLKTTKNRCMQKVKDKVKTML